MSVESIVENVRARCERGLGFDVGGEFRQYRYTRLKYYGEELAEVMMSNQPIFNPYKLDVKKSSRKRGKLEQVEDIAEEAEDGAEVPTSAGDSDSVKRSKRRARKAVFDYAMCNPDLDVFLTFTLSAENIDRYDYKAVIKKLNTWLDNMVRRHGLKYIFVCEQHKDGAIHFHGVANSGALKLIDSGHKDKRGHTVYNVSNWKLGFSTAIDCYGDRASVCKYITKYITKAVEKVGGRWYYSGGELASPLYDYLDETTPEDWAELGDGFELYTKIVDGTKLELSILNRTWK